MPTATSVRFILLGLVLFACERRRAPEPPSTPPPAPERPSPPAPPPASGNAYPETACGQSGMPDCPLQGWMDSHLNNALSNGDLAAVARGLRQLAADPPPGFIGWDRLAEAGAHAADNQDQSGVRQACDGCHDEHRERYRNTIRARPVRMASDSH